MGYVTCACLGVSLVCLCVHLIVTILAPELHNLSGKNLFSLSLALIGFYSTFMLNMFIIEISEVIEMKLKCQFGQLNLVQLLFSSDRSSRDAYLRQSVQLKFV